MRTTHVLDLNDVAVVFDHIEEGDPLTIPLTARRPHPHGYVFRVNEFDLPLEVVQRNRRSMIEFWTAKGQGDECRRLLELHGMCINSWQIPAGAEIREVTEDE